jgi:hypothetical protein
LGVPQLTPILWESGVARAPFSRLFLIGVMLIIIELPALVVLLLFSFLWGLWLKTGMISE